VHSIRLPFHLELNHVYAHAVPDGDGWILVDTGFGTEESFEALQAGLRSHGVAWRDLHTILLTHCHPDHMAWAARIRELSGALLRMHPLEVDFLERMSGPPRLDPNLERWGTPPDLAGQVAESMAVTGRVFHTLTPDRPLEDGGRAGPLEAVWTPGHARGHLCLLHREQRYLISGDHVLPTITPHVAWTPEGDALADFLRSLDRVASLDVDTVIPSHGEPFAGLAARAREIARHHEWRCQMIRRAQAEGARSPHEIVGKLWNRDVFPLSPFQYRFAIYEVMAHIRFMEHAA